QARSLPPRQRQPEKALAGLCRSLPVTWPRPRALVADLDGADITEAPLGRTWARFFPAVPPKRREIYSYPVPLTKSFWQQYAEPIEDFVEGALALHRAVRGLAASSDEERGRGRAGLAALLAPIAMGTAEADGG